MKILIVGGSKSGKSMAAQRIARMLAARGSCPAYYWATMEPSDSEDEKRIARHLEARAGWGFETIECGRNTSAFSASVRGGCVLFDSVTALLANEMFPPPAQNADFSVDFAAGERVAAELSEIANEAMHFVCVCDDIFRDGMQYDAVTESYRRALAFVCRQLASEFDIVVEASSGIMRTIKGNALFLRDVPTF